MYHVDYVSQRRFSILPIAYYILLVSSVLLRFNLNSTLVDVYGWEQLHKVSSSCWRMITFAHIDRLSFLVCLQTQWLVTHLCISPQVLCKGLVNRTVDCIYALDHRESKLAYSFSFSKSFGIYIWWLNSLLLLENLMNHIRTKFQCHYAYYTWIWLFDVCQ